MNEWLSERADRLAGSAASRDELDLTPGEIEALLDLARVAAHESGDRRNAPLVCYLVGAATASGKRAEELARLALETDQP